MSGSVHSSSGCGQGRFYLVIGDWIDSYRSQLEQLFQFSIDTPPFRKGRSVNDLQQIIEKLVKNE